MVMRTTCPACKGSVFEASEETVSGSSFVVVFVRCSQCGAAVGTMDKVTTNEIYAQLEAIKKHLGML